MLLCTACALSEVLGLKVIFSSFSLHDFCSSCAFEKANFKSVSYLLTKLTFEAIITIMFDTKVENAAIVFKTCHI